MTDLKALHAELASQEDRVATPALPTTPTLRTLTLAEVQAVAGGPIVQNNDA